jgi:hypothetical protein
MDTQKINPDYTREDVSLAYSEVLALTQQLGTSDALHVIAERIAQLRAKVDHKYSVRVVVPEVARPGDTLVVHTEGEPPRIDITFESGGRNIRWGVSAAELKRYRTQRKLTGRELAAILGYEESRIWKWERGSESVPRRAERFLALFRLLPDELQQRFIQQAVAQSSPKRR